MGWFALCDQAEHAFDLRGLARPRTADTLVAPTENALIIKGSIVIEIRTPEVRRPRPLLAFRQDGEWPMQLSLSIIPGGGLVFVLDQGGEVLHKTVNYCTTGRVEAVRITYSWNAPERWGRLAIECPERNGVILVPVPNAQPIRARDARHLITPGANRYLAPDVLYLAMSDDIEPIGPMPSLAVDTPVETRSGFRPIGDIRQGDFIRSPSGGMAEVLHAVRRTVPAAGSFTPTRIRAAYMGLQRDVIVAPYQRMILTGPEVDYLFGADAALVPVRNIAAGTDHHAPHIGKFVTYAQVLLASGQTINMAGAEAESLYIGRLKRQEDRLKASILRGLDRCSIPDHRHAIDPVLTSFDATVLAEHRAA